MSSQKDYTEILCTAVDEIITARLQGLEYDITKLCTVVDNSRKNEGRYVVSDGATRFEAFSTENNYQVGNSVQVLIPNGDYTLQKTIVGRIAATDTTPFNYTSPISTMVKITNNIFDSKDAIRTSGALLANENYQYTCTEPLYSITCHDNQFAGFSRLGVTADFRSWLSNFDVISGIYGLRILIYADSIDQPGHNINQVYELTFNTSDMIGNPYQFDSYFNQEKVFDISNISNINQIDVSFYQNGSFKNGIGKPIDWSVDGTTDGRLPNNLFVDNIGIYLGYEQDKYTDETLMVYSQNGETYYPHSDGSSDVKNIGLRWIHKISDTTFEMLSESALKENNIDAEALEIKKNEEIAALNFSDYGGDQEKYLAKVAEIHEHYNYLMQKYHIHWFQYSPGYGEINKYAGKDWKEIKNFQDSFNFAFTPNAKKRTEEIRAISFINEGEITTPYNSNTLVFTNEVYVPDDITQEAILDLTVQYSDNSKGNYFIYNQNGKIINEGQGQGYVRQLKPVYKGNDVLPTDFWDDDYITWYLPTDADNEDCSMVIHEYDVKKMLHNTEYAIFTRKPDNGIIPSASVNYSIKNVLRSESNNNTIRCVMRYHGTEYEAVEELRFGKAGTNGTNVTFIIEFDGQNNALVAGVGKTVGVKARRYDADGHRVDFTDAEVNNITWGWYTYTNDNPNPHMEITVDKNKIENEDGQTIEKKKASVTITCKTSTVPDNNYSILKATYALEENGPKLEAYLPIPIKANGYSHIEGAREVIYNHQGTPSYYSDAYELFDKDNNKIEKNIEWNIKNNEVVGDSVASNAYLPDLISISSKPGKKGFLASQFYASGYNHKTCVSCTVEDNTVWSQPILIMQSQYDFAMLNEWGGGLTLDDKNGTILSTMLGAGRKDSQNKFSGVLIGDIATGTGKDDADSQTGVYGLHEGVISYALKEDGTATFGKAGHGQIHIDGNEGTIKSSQFDKGQGMKIDLDDGIFHTKDNQAEVYISPGKEEKGRYFEIKSINGNSLIKVGKDGYLLKSDNGLSTLDLDKGEFKSQSGKGHSISISPISPYFEIITKYNKDGSQRDAPLIHIADDKYYLQSANYQPQQDIYAKVDSSGYVLNNKNQQVYKNIDTTYKKISITADDYQKDAYYVLNDLDNYTLANTWSDTETYYEKKLDYIDADLLESEYEQNKYYIKQDNFEEAGKVWNSSEIYYIRQIVYEKIDITEAEFKKSKLTYYTFIGYDDDDNAQFNVITIWNKDVDYYIQVYEYKIIELTQKRFDANQSQQGSSDYIQYYINEQNYILDQSPEWSDTQTYFNQKESYVEVKISYDEFEQSKYYIHEMYVKAEDEEWQPDVTYYIRSNDTYISLASSDNEYEYLYVFNQKGENENKISFTENKDSYIINTEIYTATDEYKTIASRYENSDLSKEKKEAAIKQDILTARQNTVLKKYYLLNSSGSGVNFNLSDGFITGYDLMLKAIKGTDSKGKYVLIDSKAEKYPFRIGSGFSVDWDGNLSCSKLKSLNNDGNNNKPISINNNFSVSASGGASGSGARWSGSSLSGFVSGKGTFTELNAPNPFNVGGTSVKLRYNSFVTAITVSGSTETIKSDYTTSLNSSDITLDKNLSVTVSGGGYGAASQGGTYTVSGSVKIPKNTVVAGISSNKETKVLTKVTVTATKLGGYYLGTSTWSSTSSQDTT